MRTLLERLFLGVLVGVEFFCAPGDLDLLRGESCYDHESS